MRFGCWLTKTASTHSEYVILIALQLQQWLRERALMLCYTHTACPVYLSSPMHKVPGFFGVKRLEREANQPPPPPCAHVKKEWSYTSIRPTCVHGVGTDNFTIYSAFSPFSGD